MWQRFTERARRVVFFAQEEAGRLGENYVSTEHLLLALVREAEGLAGRVLVELGVTIEGARDAVAKLQDCDPELKSRIKVEIPLQRIIVEDKHNWRKRSLVTLFDVSPEQFQD